MTSFLISRIVCKNLNGFTLYCNNCIFRQIHFISSNSDIYFISFTIALTSHTVFCAYLVVSKNFKSQRIFNAETQRLHPILTRSHLIVNRNWEVVIDHISGQNMVAHAQEVKVCFIKSDEMLTSNNISRSWKKKQNITVLY